MNTITMFTIGFTQKSAKEFFEMLKQANIKRVIDIRLNNVSQLAGFSKRDDLVYFLRELCECEYLHQTLLAPTKDILDDYKKKRIGWPEYEKRFNALLIVREAHKLHSLSDLDMSCLLCSEVKPDKCHRRLVAEYFQKHLGGLNIQHL
jgi:uncharacterized protein (DUF488 family)